MVDIDDTIQAAEEGPKLEFSRCAGCAQTITSLNPNKALLEQGWLENGY